MNSLGERIAFYRKKIQLTQEQLAEKCSVTAQAVSKWENDLTAPDIALLAPLSKLFGITCDELLGVCRGEAGLKSPELVDISKTLIKVKVDSARGDKINVNLPVTVADAFLKSTAIFGDSVEILQSIDFAQIISLIKAGVVGKLVDVKSAEGDTVEVWVE